MGGSLSLPSNNDQLWQQLVKSAVLGSERSPAPALVAAAESESQLGNLLAQVKPANREAGLLSMASMVSTYERCGLLLKAEAGAGSPLELCEPDTLQRCSPTSISYLRRILGGEYLFLLPEFLGAMQSAGKRLPEELLPEVLDSLKQGFSNQGFSSNHPQMRTAANTVIGRRGHWLARLNPEWSFIGAAIAPADWETSDRASRVDLLRRLRQDNANPEQARALVQSTWSTDTPEDRIAFIGEFKQGLSLEDQAFLEAALDDRRKEVRQQAAELLMTMSDSALVQRLWQRVAPRVRLQPASGLKLKKLLGKATIEVHLPDRWEDSMQHDAIEEKPPQGLGEKSWWLYQMVRAVPPERWESHLQLSPERCVAAFADSEFGSSALLPAIADSALRHRDARWAKPLVGIGIAGSKESPLIPAAGSALGKLLGTIVALEEDEPDRDAIIVKLLDQHGQAAEAFLGLRLLHSCPGPWSAGLARSLLKLLRSITRQMAAGKASPFWAGLGDLPTLGGRMPVSIADEAQEGWPDDATGKPFFKPIQNIIDIVQFRSKMLKEITR
jgi:hypothetical protein